MDLMPKSELISYIQHAFVSLVPLKGSPVLDTSSPNKFFESLAAGIPVIQNTQGWMKDFLDKHKVGFTLDPDDPQQLVDTLIWMKDNPVETCRMGVNGLSVAKSYFDKDHLANKMLAILKQVYVSR
jgi:glycosyltransferase involved in cell wall biosynthesis